MVPLGAVVRCVCDLAPTYTAKLWWCVNAWDMAWGVEVAWDTDTVHFDMNAVVGVCDWKVAEERCCVLKFGGVLGLWMVKR